MTGYGDEVPVNDLYVFNEDFGKLDVLKATVLEDSNGGTDTINAAPIRSSVIIDLATGDDGKGIIMGRTFTIKQGVLIENAMTGDGDDTLIGNDASPADGL